MAKDLNEVTSGSDASKEKLLSAAKLLFAERGFESVSVREIADEAGIHFGLIRYHYGSKEGLYRACIERYGRERLQSALRFLEPAKTQEEFRVKLKFVIDDVLELQMKDPALTKIVLREVEAEHPIADEILKKTMITMAKAFIKFFKDAQERDLVRKDLDPMLLTHTLQGCLNHLVRTDARRRQNFQFTLTNLEQRAQAADFVLELFLTGALEAGAQVKPVKKKN